MRGCCCLRPTWRRLVDSIYPKPTKGSETETTLTPQNLSKLTHYALTHPSKLGAIGRYETLTHSSLTFHSLFHCRF